MDRRFGHYNVRFFASLRSAQNDTGMIIWLPHNIEMIPEQDVLAGIGLMQRQIEYLGTRVEEI